MIVANSNGMKPKDPALIGKNRMPAPTAVPNSVITHEEVDPAGSAFFFACCFVVLVAGLAPLVALWLFVLIAVAFLCELGVGRRGGTLLLPGRCVPGVIRRCFGEGLGWTVLGQ